MKKIIRELVPFWTAGFGAGIAIGVVVFAWAYFAAT